LNWITGTEYENKQGMINRRKMAAANWKMNLTVKDGLVLAREIIRGLPNPLDADVVIAPSFPHLVPLLDEAGNSGLQVGAQNCFTEKSGAFTGEVSIGMLQEIGVQYVIAGHSERRQLFGETNAIVKTKVDLILNAGITPIFCCGEPLEIRNQNGHTQYVRSQLEEGLFHLPADVLKTVIIAYEPIWAIGTGVTARPEQAQEMHAFIRQSIVEKYSHDTADQIRILYGGSIKADNARMLFSQHDVDGGLVGGASLVGADFLAIIAAACG
jgi:triosephosphate isomerase